MSWSARSVALLIGLPVGLGAQGSEADPLRWEPISNAGVLRASAQVDSVFVDRQTTRLVVSGGDWVSYLAARLGVVPIPEGTNIRVAVDTVRILVDGQLRDLPLEARAALGVMGAVLDSTTALRAEIVMAPSGAGHVRFVLRRFYVNGFPIPESLLGPALAQIGKQYPALTESGRQLFVAVPADGDVWLGRNGVHAGTGITR